MKKKIKKIIPVFLVLLTLAGLLSSIVSVYAQAIPPDTVGACTYRSPVTGQVVTQQRQKGDCEDPAVLNGTWAPNPTGTPTPPTPYDDCIANVGKPGRATTAASCAGMIGGPAAGNENILEKNLISCGVIVQGSLGGCLVTLFYYIFYGLMSFLLTVTAKFFDIVLALALSSALYGDFIYEAWAIVRDLSNLFFILILLYIAIKTILGLGGSEVKKMVVHVIIMALLINFSMFFSKIIIDSSNILALVFYNKISVTVVKAGKTEPIEYLSSINPTSGVQDKDVAGGLVSRFDPSKLLTQDFFDRIKKTTHEFSAAGFAAYVGTGALIGTWIPIPGVGTGVGAVAGALGYWLSSGSTAVPIPLMLGIIVISGAVMAFAAYSFLIAGISFLSRLIELWILIIFSPFAFMSFTVPFLSGGGYIGWDAWIKRLLKVSFMAPVFMFFLYLIFKIIQADPIAKLLYRPNIADQGWMETLLLLIIPALIILILLNKTTKFAKEASGELGEMVFKGAKMVGGLALGAATGGAALAGRAVIGGGLGGLANKVGANRLGSYLQSKSYDVRGIKGVQALAGAGGIKLGEAQKGGIEQTRKDKKEKRDKRVNELRAGAEKVKVGEDDKLKQELNEMEMGLQELLNANVDKIRKFDKAIADAQQDLNEAAPADKAARAADLKTARNAKKLFKTTTRNSFGSIDDLENTLIPDQKDKIATENKKRTKSYAEKIGRMGGKANREARHKIIMESPLNSGEKTK